MSTMNLQIITEQGWTEIIIKQNCEFDEFNKIADVLKKDFGITFIEILNGLDAIYLDFDYKSGELSLHYNYMDVSLFPRKLQDATAIDNSGAIEIGTLLFNRINEMN
jgi:hypothetical protein